MTLLFQKSIVLAKLESVYGQNASPAAADDAFVTSVPTVAILGEHRERNIARAGFGMPVGINVGQGLHVEFSHELMGTTDDGDTPPKIFTLFRACGLTQSIISLTSGTLTPNSNHDGESLTLILNFDGIQHVITGCTGDWDISFENNNIVNVNFKFDGIYAGDQASDVAFPTGTFDDTPDKPLFRGANFTINGNSDLVIENVNVKPGNNIFRRPGSNAASGTHRYSIVSRSPELSFEPEAVALATFDPFALYENSTSFDITFEVKDLNDTPGQQWTFYFYNCQIKDSPTYGQRESIRTWPLTLIPHASIANGNDDFKIVCTLPAES